MINQIVIFMIACMTAADHLVRTIIITTGLMTLVANLIAVMILAATQIVVLVNVDMIHVYHAEAEEPEDRIYKPSIKLQKEHAKIHAPSFFNLIHPMQLPILV